MIQFWISDRRVGKLLEKTDNANYKYGGAASFNQQFDLKSGIKY